MAGVLPRLARRLYRSLPAQRRASARRIVGELLTAEARAPRIAGNLEVLVPVPGRGAFLSGWIGGLQPGDRVELVAASGARAELGSAWKRFSRADLEERGPHTDSSGPRPEAQGFACLARLENGARGDVDFRLEVSDATGLLAALPTPTPILDPERGRARIFESLLNGGVDDDLLAGHVHPAVTTLTEQLIERTEISDIIEHGRSPTDPEVSIVVPLYRRLDLLTPQVALLADDPDLRDAELLLVLDSPEDAEALAELSYDLYRLYGLPMRILMLNRNAGYGAASNLGAERARGSLILLFNSDVFPDKRGWLRQVTHAYRSNSRIGALAPKLLYEDRSVQHAGLYFERDPVTGHWQNQHYCKGLPSNSASANVTKRVPGVSGACMVVDSGLFRQLGGLDPSYVRGDYEDSDLCLRLAAEGRESWYLSEVELYHLERQSMRKGDAAPLTKLITDYNGWLQTHRWDSEIGELMRTIEPSS